jgi:hypothetical protein
MTYDREKFDRMYERAERILEGHGNGFGEPILWHLALRKYGRAMLDIANRATRSGKRADLGRIADAFSPAGMIYRAFRLGEPNAAQNMAMSLFNIGDMQGYRHWLRRAARAGDCNATVEVSWFETRQPHELARRWRRLRPLRRDGS